MLININGQNYGRWEDVPEDVRKQLATTLPDADQNGVPDVFEGNLAGLGNLPTTGQPTFTSISIDGQQVSSLGQLPPEVQELLRSTLGIYQPGSVAAPPPVPPSRDSSGPLVFFFRGHRLGRAISWKRGGCFAPAGLATT